MQRRITKLAGRLALAALLGGLAGGAAAHKISYVECIEGSDFIKNAAMSRDNGLSREAFLDRLEGDLRAIRAFPPHLRWFVQDQDDESLLLDAARQVFDAPREPSSHQSAFMASCIARVGWRGDGAILLSRNQRE